MGGAIASETSVGNPTGAILRRYVYGPGADEPLVWYEGAGANDRRWLHADERGSVIAVSDGSGAALRINTYDDYGIPASGNLGRFQYTGQAYYPSIGLYDYKARMYSPTLGRFLQTDPIGYADGVNWYAYTGNDPINATDPSGLDQCLDMGQVTLASGYTDKEGAIVAPKCGGTIPDFGGSPRYSGPSYGGGGSGGGSRLPRDLPPDPVTTPRSPTCPRGVGAFLAPGAASEATTVGAMLSAGARAALSAVGIAFMLSGDTNKGAHDLYRAVGPAELGSIRATGRFSLGPSGFSQKQFFTDLSSAQWYASWAVSSGADRSSTIVQTTVTDYTFSAGYHFRDAGRPAVSYSAPALQEVNKDAAVTGIHEVGGC